MIVHDTEADDMEREFLGRLEVDDMERGFLVVDVEGYGTCTLAGILVDLCMGTGFCHVFLELAKETSDHGA